MKYDILIRGGHVIDPSQNLTAIRDVAVSGDRIHKIDEKIDPAEARYTVDARGLYVVPGLIDLHAHVYPHSPFGLEPDPLCAAGGVTTILDTGTAGSYQFGAFRRNYIDTAVPEVLALVNLSCIGLLCGQLGELLDRRYADPEGVVRTIREHPDVAVGVKIRVGKHLIGEGQQGWDNFHDAVRAARESGTWLMIHIGECPMPVPEMFEHLQPGDCITHCFKGGSTRILDETDRLYDAVREAAERGIIFDVGHGAGSFQWEVVEPAVEQGFEPTTISTDLHVRNIHGPVYDMPTTMSKFLKLGFSLEKVIEMSTAHPAQALGRENEIGTLKEGTRADIALLERREGRFQFTDSYGTHRVGTELLAAALTIRSGQILPGGGSQHARRLAEETA